ncbi:MAG: non-canonical purine NTP pyrophosphatase, partial [Candidatus Limnocylindrus sp.]
MRRLLVATSSAHKLAELQRLFVGLPLTLVTLRDLMITEEAPESGETFEENALQKAHFYAAASGEWTLADDSGLEVDALNGAPGVYTRRYAGPNATDQQNYEKLLQELRGVPADRRSARFVCGMAL